MPLGIFKKFIHLQKHLASTTTEREAALISTMLDLPPISRAEEAEKRYDFLEAARLYLQCAPSEGEERSLTTADDLGNIEHAAYCYTRAGFQADTHSDFVSTLGQAAELYDYAIRILEVPDSNSNAQSSKQSSQVLYFRSKLELVKALQLNDSALRKEKIKIATALAEECFFNRNLENLPSHTSVLRPVEAIEAGKFANHLLSCYSEEIVSEFSKVRCEEIIQKALTCAEESVRAFSALSVISSDDSSQLKQEESRQENFKKELTRAYISLSWFCHLGEVIFDSEERRDELSRRKKECWNASERLLANSNDSLLQLDEQLHSYHRSTYRLRRMEEVAKRLLPELRKSRDNVAIAGACGSLSFGIRWRMFEQDKPHEIKDMLQEIRTLFAELDRRYAIATPLGVHWSWLVIFHWMLISGLIIASGFEMDTREKKSLLSEAFEAAKQARSKYQGYSRVRYMDLAVAQSARLLAETQSAGQQQDTEISRSLLRQGLSAIRSAIRIGDELEPYYAWDQVVLLSELASIASKLSALEDSESDKENLLDEAVSGSTRALALLPKMKPEQEFGSSATLRIASYFELHSSILMSLYQIKSDRELLHKRLAGLEEARRIYENSDLPSRAAETLWEIASTHSLLLDYAKASLNYEHASKRFVLASQKIPAFNAYFEEYSRYMIAWSKIERARASHENEEYQAASAYYLDASKILSTTHSWIYLSTYYLAFSRLETAEEYSALSQIDNAIEAFGDAEVSFETSLIEGKRGDRKEKEQSDFSTLSRSTAIKAKYCAARKLMEEGRQAHKRGDVSQSISKYSKSINILTDLKKDAKAAEVSGERRELDGNEIRTMISFHV